MNPNRDAPTALCWHLPRTLAPIFRAIYHVHFAACAAVRRLYVAFYAGPLFRSRCDAIGKGFRLLKIPHVDGHGHVLLGDNVRLRGHLGVASGRVFDRPQLVIGDRVDIGHETVLTVNLETSFDSGVYIGEGCRFLDTNGHPRDALLRAANVPPGPEEIKPIRVCKDAVIGRGSYILRGVTVGEGATVLPNSVVVADVPAFSVVAGNPVRTLSRKNV